MTPPPGPVVRAADVRADRTAAGAVVRTMLDTGQRFIRRLVEVPPGVRLDGTAGPAGELWFVIDGSGQLDAAGQPGRPLRPDQGMLLPPGIKFSINGSAGAGLRLDAVTLPGAASQDPPGQPDQAGPQLRDLRDCDVETTGDRQFRVLFGPGVGCAVATQFVGEIPPGRAPEHSHPYDEVVLVLAGDGVLHAGGAGYPLAAGSCAHLPARLVHCLENTGTARMRVLGVFHPANSPAAKT
jgi:mannose-6-phosphate isomerase-like protein (cupin superfamily)